ncbi:hypothetical protein [Streptomyces sp. FL07-04A]|uniref:hypothetical protein n=1 Tax=Streptomyces sp. FL07-04A TaxID=3028658 RepID=UPI0029B151C9|nr:hypothetical protein [Streptomyces sp. FL07-04A]MDX3579932.1 hypothetical protein [Streptomyces sp. FL07-04A]
MLRKLRLRHLLTVAIAMPTAMILASGSAHAAGNTTVVYTADGGSIMGGKAILFGKASPERLQACDTETDGHSVIAIVTWNDRGPRGREIVDSDGSSDFCDNKPGNITAVDIPEGTSVQVTACLYESGTKKKWACNHETGEA